MRTLEVFLQLSEHQIVWLDSALPISKETQAYVRNWTLNNMAVRGIWQNVHSRVSDLTYAFEKCISLHRILLRE